jgi:phospholipid/cholesterol/gamma-HCH transport system ATP-binding protein
MLPVSESPITCENLTAGYPGRPVLRGIDMQFRRGAITVLLGGSGSGKSTLLKTLIGLLPPLEGRVTLFGEDLYALDPDARAALLRRTGMLFQYGALFGSATVADNVALPLREHTDMPPVVIDELVRMKLSLVGLSGLEQRLPSQVSGGQQKRVALVRATALDPELLFADEPSAGLDPVAAAGLDRLLRSFQRLFSMTLVVVTHELESIRLLADHVVMLGDGKILQQGPLEALTASDIPDVHAFFNRVAPDYMGRGEQTLLDCCPVSDHDTDASHHEPQGSERKGVR